VILDRLDHCDLYRHLSPGFAAGFDYLRNTDLAALADGRYKVSGDDVVAVVQTYQTKPLDQGRWEAHRRHADIQYIVTGGERMGIATISAMRLQPPYDPEKDLEFYTGNGQIVTVGHGSFTVFLPQDIHMPNLAIDTPAEVKKVVIKVRL
jgi:YhcH/YjgK/YiaL family protein